MSLPKGLVAKTIRDLGIEVEYEDGDELWALCPGHEGRLGRKDSNPSWSVNIRHGASYCFSCGYKASLSSLVYDLAGPEAAKALRTDRSEGLAGDTKYRVKRGVRPADLFFRTEEVKVIPESELILYEEPPDWALLKRQVSLMAVRDFGVLWHARAACWILPMRWPDGSLMGWQVKGEKHRVFRNAPLGMPKARSLFGITLFTEGSVVLVESPLDAVRLRTLGYQAVACCGSKVSDTQADLLSTFDRVVLALDDDGPGREETKRVIRSTPPFRYSRIRYRGSGKDPGEMEESDVRAALDEVY